MFKKSQILFIIAFLILIIILVFVVIFSGGENVTQTPPTTIPVFSPPPSGVFKPLEIKPILTQEVPLKPEDQGGGVDLESSLVTESQTEVKKLLPSLPYRNSFLAPSGKTISILIPGIQFQTTPWLIDAQIFDVDYSVTEGDPDYNTQKDLFLTAAGNIFEWMKAHGIDPEKLIINWGDRVYIQERAEKWLSE